MDYGRFTVHIHYDGLVIWSRNRLLFILISHYRDELRKVKDKRQALINAFKGASGAIAMSGFTVVISLLALIVAKYGAYHRFAIPFSLSILIMGLASLTLIPALLAVMGRGSFILLFLALLKWKKNWRKERKTGA